MSDEWDASQMIAGKTLREMQDDWVSEQLEEMGYDGRSPLEIAHEKWWRVIKNDYSRKVVYDRQHGVDLWTGNWNDYPQVIDEVYIPGFGPAGVIECPVCGARAEQFNRDENPIRYVCTKCMAITSNLGAGWYVRKGQVR